MTRPCSPDNTEITDVSKSPKILCIVCSNQRGFHSIGQSGARLSTVKTHLNSKTALQHISHVPLLTEVTSHCPVFKLVREQSLAAANQCSDTLCCTSVVLQRQTWILAQAERTVCQLGSSRFGSSWHQMDVDIYHHTGSSGLCGWGHRMILWQEPMAEMSSQLRLAAHGDGDPFAVGTQFCDPCTAMTCEQQRFPPSSTGRLTCEGLVAWCVWFVLGSWRSVHLSLVVVRVVQSPWVVDWWGNRYCRQLTIGRFCKSSRAAVSVFWQCSGL